MLQDELRDPPSGVDTAALQWVIDLYTLTYAVFILTGGTLADLLGYETTSAA